MSATVRPVACSADTLVAWGFTADAIFRAAVGSFPGKAEGWTAAGGTPRVWASI